MDKKYCDKRPLQFQLILRVVCGVYLVYLGASLKDAVFSSDKGFIFGVAMVLFICVGALLCVLSVNAIAKGNYRLEFEQDDENQNDTSQGDNE